MTAKEAIETASALRPNDIGEALLLRFLSELEGRIAVEVRGESPNGANTPDMVLENTLSVPAPFDRLYWCYLMAMIDLCAGASATYALPDGQYREALHAYACWYQRTGGKALC